MDTNISRRQQHLYIIIWLLITTQIILVFALTEPMIADSRKYLDLAQALANGFYGIILEDSYIPEAVRPPGYPVLLWFFLYMLKLPLFSVLIFQFVLYIASICLVQRLLVAYKISPLPFLVLVLLYPFTAAYAARIMTEGITTFLVTVTVYLLARPQPLHASVVAIIGFIAGAEILIRPDLLLLPFGLAAIVFFRQQSDHVPNSKSLLNATLVVIIAGLTLLPYAYRNYLVFGALNPLPPAGAVGNSLYLATWEWKIKNEDVLAWNQGQWSSHLHRIGFTEEVARINTSIGAPPATIPNNPENYPTLHMQLLASRTFAREALRRMEAVPGDYIKHVISSWWRLWNTAEYPARLPSMIKVSLMLSAAAVCLLGLGGAVFLLAQRQNNLLKIPALVMLYFPLIHCWLHTEARYTASARLLLLLTASLLLVAIYRRYAQQEHPPIFNLLPARRERVDSRSSCGANM